MIMNMLLSMMMMMMMTVIVTVKGVGLIRPIHDTN